MAKQTIKVDGKEISISLINEEDYISLTDISKGAAPEREPSQVIRDYLRNAQTLLFLEAWEGMHNPDFKHGQMHRFRLDAQSRAVSVTPKTYTEQTAAIGIVSRSGRYGGTYAHKDIAFEFASWISPRFKLFVIKDYQRLKEAEQARLAQGWDVARLLSKVNYSIHTESIRKNILPRLEGRTPDGLVFASEADLLNYVAFGMTAKEWKEANPDQAKKGNIRDFATLAELTVLSNLESYNAELTRLGVSRESRLLQLLGMAHFQLQIVSQDSRLKGLED